MLNLACQLIINVARNSVLWVMVIVQNFVVASNKFNTDKNVYSSNPFIFQNKILIMVKQIMICNMFTL
jgi:hypothetical protein